MNKITFKTVATTFKRLKNLASRKLYTTYNNFGYFVLISLEQAVLPLL